MRKTKRNIQVNGAPRLHVGYLTARLIQVLCLLWAFSVFESTSSPCAVECSQGLHRSENIPNVRLIWEYNLPIGMKCLAVS